MSKVKEFFPVYIFLVLMTIMNISVVVGNREAKKAAKAAVISANKAKDAAEKAVQASSESRDGIAGIAKSNAEQINSHHIRNEAEHTCLLTGLVNNTGNDFITRYQTCIDDLSKGTLDPPSIK